MIITLQRMLYPPYIFEIGISFQNLASKSLPHKLWHPLFVCFFVSFLPTRIVCSLLTQVNYALRGMGRWGLFPDSLNELDFCLSTELTRWSVQKIGISLIPGKKTAALLFKLVKTPEHMTQDRHKYSPLRNISTGMAIILSKTKQCIDVRDKNAPKPFLDYSFYAHQS